jgi:hypothetical protein
MKTLIQIICVSFLTLVFTTNSFSQYIEFDLTFTGDTVLYPFENIENISEMTMDGNVEFFSDTSLVRLILEDENGYKYMIFESYPLISAGPLVSASEYCDETCALNECNPYSLIVQVINAEFLLKDLYYTVEPKQSAEEQRYEAKRAKDAVKIEAMNGKIHAYGMNWTAGDNSIVANYYEQKKQMFGEGYNLLGYEYYYGGVFEFLGHRNYPKVDPNLVRNFDWRNRHGADNPESQFYWDGDALGTGWLTPVKNQKLCKGCWAFAAAGVTEAIANLYAAHHIDYDLSEQDLLCNSDPDGSCSGGSFYPARVYIYIKDTGIITEDCYQFDTINYTNSCQTIDPCNNPNPIIKIEDTIYFNTTIEEEFDNIRKELINRGPLKISYNISKTTHAVVLTGFNFNSEDSTLTWIIKNSWGNVGINHGFDELKLEYINNAYAVETPIYKNDTALIQSCHDYDLDGYFFWGIGEKPDNCNCPEIEDCDDNNPYVGGYDENYNCLCLFEYVSNLEHIVQDTTWNDSINLNHPVIVDSGACLTITNDVMCSPQVKITVNRGGRLILDGGRLTNSCPGFWEGIDVLGQDTCQYYSQYFGILEIRNGGIIENARIAVSNYCKQCMDPLGYSGGIIKASDAIFRNNQVAIEFSPFRNIYLGTERPYLGSLKRCHFIYDELLQDYGDFRYFIKLNQVNGITINGCDFIADTSSINPEYVRTLKYRSGIYAIGSQFFVDEACTTQSVPCSEFVPSIFQGLNYGIYALGIEGTETAEINNCTFKKNNTGIYLCVMDNVSIVQDTFEIIEARYNLKDTLCGLYLDNCTAFQVEENVFHGLIDISNPIQSPIKKIGLTINNSGVHNNEIYNNYYDSLSVGILTLDLNRSADGKTGLQILCNDFSKCCYDISIDKTGSAGNNMGIREYQGSNGSERTSPANNTFSWIREQYSDYFNNCEGILYWHLDSTLTSAHIQPVDFSSNISLWCNDQIPHEYDKELCCPSKLDTIGGDSLITDLKIKMLTAKQQTDSILDLLDMLVDGGSTEDLIFFIQTSIPEEAISLYDELLTMSPYLSDTSMVEAINKEEVLSSSLITDILTENPQSAKSDTVQLAPDARSDQLSAEQRDAINYGWFSIGAKESLESELAFTSSIRSREFNKLIRYFKNDTTMFSAYDSIITFLTNENTLESKYSLALEYLNNADSNSAINVLENIPLTFSLSASQVNHHQNFEEYLDLRTSLLAEGKSLLDADSLEKIQIRSLFNIADGSLKMRLKNVLFEIDDFYYQEPYILPEVGQKQTEHKPNSQYRPIYSNGLKLYPNPAADLCIIEYTTKSLNNITYIQIIDIEGRKIKDLQLNKSSDLVLLRINDISSGVYLIQLVENGVITSSQKLIRK